LRVVKGGHDHVNEGLAVGWTTISRRNEQFDEFIDFHEPREGGFSRDLSVVTKLETSQQGPSFCGGPRKGLLRAASYANEAL